MSTRRVAPVYSPVRARSLWGAAWASVARHSASVSAVCDSLRAHYPTKDVLFTDSGTSALALALRATDQEPANDDRLAYRCVALPAYCCPDVGTAAVGAGYRIRLYDVDPATLGPDVSSLRRALGRGATHVVITHLFGRPVDIPAVAALVHSHRAVLIEDAAQHAGGCWQGVRAGSLAPWSVLSFGRGKGLNAGGGGALLYERGTPAPSSPPLAPWWRSLRDVLAATAAELLVHPAVYGVPAALPFLHLGDTRYREPSIVRGPSAANLVLLAAALEAEPRVLAARQRMERWYREQLKDCRHLDLAPLPAAAVSGALRYPVRLAPELARPLERFGVVRSYPRTLADYPELAGHIDGPIDPLPGATALAQSLHTLPTHDLTTDAERQAIVRSLRSITA